MRREHACDSVRAQGLGLSEYGLGFQGVAIRIYSLRVAVKGFGLSSVGVGLEKPFVRMGPDACKIILQ